MRPRPSSIVSVRAVQRHRLQHHIEALSHSLVHDNVFDIRATGRHQVLHGIVEVLVALALRRPSAALEEARELERKRVDLHNESVTHIVSPSLPQEFVAVGRTHSSRVHEIIEPPEAACEVLASAMAVHDRVLASKHM